MTDFLHHARDRTYYSLSEHELGLIESGANPIWKDLCLVACPIFLATLLNALAELNSQPTFDLTLSLFLNLLFSATSLFCGVGFGLAWRKAAKSFRSVRNSLREKPALQFSVQESESRVELSVPNTIDSRTSTGEPKPPL